MKFDPLTGEQVSEIMESLNEAQRNFMNEKSKQDKKSAWLEALAGFKGIVITTEMDLAEIINQVNDWVLVDILDGGRFSRPYRCECGKDLRFQYIVTHQGQGITYKLGETCFEHYTKLPPAILKDIQNGFYHIDLERDEILARYKRGESFDLSPYLHLNIASDIKQQVSLGLPLSNRQIAKLAAFKEKQDLEEKSKHEYRRKFQGAIAQINIAEEKLNPAQKVWIQRFNNLERIELLKKLGTSSPSYPIEFLKEIGVNQTIINQVELGLPLLNSQLFEIERRKSRGLKHLGPITRKGTK